MKKLLFTLTCLTVSYIGLQNYCQATNYTYVNAQNGILKCNTDFSGCKGVQISNSDNLSTSYISLIKNGYAMFWLSNTQNGCQINNQGDFINCNQISLFLGGAVNYYQLGNLLYGTNIRYLNYQNNIITAYMPANSIPENINLLYPLKQIDDFQYVYAITDNSSLSLLKLLTIPSSFVGGGDSSPFNGGTQLIESATPIQTPGINLFNVTAMTSMQGNSKSYLYMAANYSINECVINPQDATLSDCISISLKDNPNNLYFDPNAFALDVVYNDHIEQCSLSSSTGNINSCKTVFTSNQINSLGFYYTPPSKVNK